jgi:hypothetical protein
MKRILIMMIFCFPMLLYGQQAVLSGGGEGSGAGGSVSYSIGQVSYVYKGPGPSVDEGVQQPIEVMIITLPVELLSFKAELTKRNTTVLSWETATELNNDYFTVERSEDGRYWEELGEVEGAGTTSEPRSYGFLDPSPYVGYTYYRLKQTDYDGSFSYSEMESVLLGKTGLMSLYPNPVKNGMTVEMGEYPSGYRIYDSYGRLVETGELEGRLTRLEMSSFPEGIYSLEVMSGDGGFMIEKFIKQ